MLSCSAAIRMQRYNRNVTTALTTRQCYSHNNTSFTTLRSKQVIAMEDFALKIYAARYARGDEDFFLVARTDARTTSAKYGLEDAITRCNLYLDAGADATLFEAP